MASLLAISQPAQALTLIGNYSSTNDGITTQPVTAGTFQRTVGFTLDSTSSNYTLNTITLRLNNYNTSAGDAALLQIYADPTSTSFDPNGATLQGVSFTNPTSSSNTAGNFNFTPTSQFTFLANTRYWVLVDASAGTFNWTSNNPIITASSTIPSVSFLLTRSSANNGGLYTATVNSSFRIDATEVVAVPFEFNPALGLGAVGGFFLIKKVLKKNLKKN